MLLFGAGLVLELVASLFMARLVAGFIFGISPFGPIAFSSISALLAIIAMLACWLPARKASRLDPLAALRHE